jgi:hypothetical protein
MEKRRRSGSLWFNIVAALIAFAAIAYLTLYARNAMQTGVITIAVIEQNTRETITISGFVSRDEELLSGDDDGTFIFVSAENGKHLSMGESVALKYTSRERWEQSTKAHELDEQIAVLEGLKTLQTTSTQARLDNALKTGVDALRTAVDAKDYRNASERANALLTLAIGGSNLKETLNLLYAERSLVADVSAGTIATRRSALFSKLADGYVARTELTPAELQKLTPSSLNVLLAEETPAAFSGVIGKLIYGRRWYYVANVDAATGYDLALKIGKSVQMQFERGYTDLLKMTIETVSFEENGAYTVVFSCDYALRETMDLRRVDAKLITKEYTGLKIPRSALRFEPLKEGEKSRECVYITTGPYLERKLVTVVHEDEDYYLIEITTSSTGLRAGDNVVISGRNLYDGKIIN